jgi:hypothetical protein
MFVSSFWFVLAWVMAVLLLANSIAILINIFNYPATGTRHLISFIAIAGFIASLIFIADWISRYFNFPRGR